MVRHRIVNQDRFLAVLRDGERLVGEWLMQAHGTRYQLKHEPFVAFDLMVSTERARYDELIARVKKAEFITPMVIHRGGPLSSCGCLHFLKLEWPLGADWGVCANPASPRAGLLTFEHQGCHFYEDDPELEAEFKRRLEERRNPSPAIERIFSINAAKTASLDQGPEKDDERD